MKAYYLSVTDEDQGGKIVFANTVNEARKHIYSTDFFYDSWLDVKARRYKAFDGMESLSDAELALHQWKEGWRWFDTDYPDPDEATDAEFLLWYESYFGKTDPLSLCPHCYCMTKTILPTDVCGKCHKKKEKELNKQ